MEPGERRFATRLLTKLEDDYHCWFNVPVGHKQLRPDFIVLHPGRGILVLEVKDWKLNNLKQVDRLTFELMTNAGNKSVPNPLEQARSYAIAIKEMLERDSYLVDSCEGRYKGRLIFPWGFGVVLPNITRKQFMDAQIDQAVPADKVICSDEMTETIEPEAFQMRLWAMFNHHFGKSLSLSHIDRIRWHLFPEIRIDQGSLFDPPEEKPDQKQSIADSVPDLVKLMDIKQEKLARDLGEGHRVIHGVAGSGKTMVLAYRCEELARSELGKPILVLCYNKTLAAKLQELMRNRNLGDAVQVRHFHGWCKGMCDLYQLDLRTGDSPVYERQVLAVIAGADSGRVPKAQYAAILIDEGHDFHPEWFKLIVQMIDPQTNSLLLLYDDAQSIYGKKRKFSWKSVGIEAAGRRSTILKVNYRNPIEVLDFAYSFVEGFLSPDQNTEDFPLVLPDKGGRHDVEPDVCRCTSMQDEMYRITKWLQKRAQDGVPYRDMAVLCRFNNLIDRFGAHLSQSGVPVTAGYGRNNSPYGFDPASNTVKILSMHACKGLEFNSVAIPDLGGMPYAKVDVTEEARVLYVALTRATHRLLVSYHKESEFTRKLSNSRRG